MAVTYSAATKTVRMQATADDCAGGTLEIGTAGMATVLATFSLSGTQTGVSGDTWTLQFTAGTVTASAGGTAAAAQIKDSGAAVVISGLTVGQGSGDLSLNNTTIANGQDVSLSGSIQHA